MTTTLNLLARVGSAQRVVPASAMRRMPAIVSGAAMAAAATPNTIAGRRAIISQGIALAMPIGSVGMPLVPCSTFHTLVGANPALQRWATYQYGADDIKPVLKWHDIGLDELKALPATERELLVLDALMQHSKRDHPHRVAAKQKKFLRRASSKRSAQRRRRHRSNEKTLRIESDAQIQDTNDYEPLKGNAARVRAALIERGCNILRSLTLRPTPTTA